MIVATGGGEGRTKNDDSDLEQTENLGSPASPFFRRADRAGPWIAKLPANWMNLKTEAKIDKSLEAGIPHWIHVAESAFITTFNIERTKRFGGT